MENVINEKSIKAEFEAQVTAALMIQSNALIPLKLAARLCGISKQEISKRIGRGTFPRPKKLSGRRDTRKKVFYLKDLHEWIKNPHMYRQKQV